MPKREPVGTNPLDVPRVSGRARETGPSSSPLAEIRKLSISSSSSERASPSPREERTETQGEGPVQCLTFFLAGSEYAVSILQVREIIEFDSMTAVPMAPPWIRGVMNLRGTAVPVVDLAVKFGLSETVIGKRTCIVIIDLPLGNEKILMGVMADAVSRVVDWAPDTIEAAPSFGTEVDVNCIDGMGQLGEKLVPILNLRQALSGRELSAVEAPALVESTMTNRVP